MKLNIPLRRRFRFRMYRSEHGFSVHVIAGFPAFFAWWRFPDWDRFESESSGISLGWVVPKTREGETFPGKTWRYHHVQKAA